MRRLFTALMFAGCALAHAQNVPTYVQSRSTPSGSGASTLAYSSNVTAGNALYAVVFWGSGTGAALSFTDSQSNTWTLSKSASLMTDGDTIGIGCTVAGSSGSDSVTFLVNGTATSIFGAIYEVKNATCTQDVAAVSSDTTGQTTCSSGALTTSTANDLLVGMCGLQNPQSSFSAGSGWSNTQTFSSLNGIDGLGELRVATSPGSYTATTGSYTPAGEQGSIEVAFKPMSGGSLPTPTLTVSSSLNPSTVGQSVTFTATISSGPTGTITFYDAGSSIGTGPISGTTATFASSSLTQGSHSITASWPGNSSYSAVTSSPITQTVNQPTAQPGTVFYYDAVYDLAGNAITISDTGVGSNSTYGYDTLNRLFSASVQPLAGGYTRGWCWSYDAFGNRTAQDFQAAPGCPTPPSLPPATASYNTNNQVTWTTVNSASAGFTYDGAGNVISDNVNTYLYDADGRICAVKVEPIQGTYTMTGYLYDAEGIRIAKGSITTWGSCDPAVNGFQLSTIDVVGPSGEQESEMSVQNGSMTWAHVNLWSDGAPMLTYLNDGNGSLHFYLNDPLGSRRAETDYSGTLQESCGTLPFGDGASCTPTPAEQLFTGKERDTESGNDYFGARYYASTMGRMLSPDPSGLFFADRTNPQSLNLYAYVRNNPLAFTDPTGLYCAWEDGTSDDDPKDGGATKKQCKQQGGHWTDAANPCHGMDNCVATFDWNNPQRDKTPTFDPRLDPQLVGVMGALPTQPTVSNVVDPDAQRIQQLADAVKKKTDCAVHSLLKSSSTIALDAVGMVPFGGTAEAIVPVANGAVSSVTSAVQGDTTGSALSTVDMVQGAAVRAVTSPAIGINAPKAIPLAGQAYSGALVARDIWNASGEYANCF
ncbi:MAG TPA: Ig-like domain repeat protein [Terracidiphilus sp.]|nr:Ig-like domain repeat protein [Terracidiphilus sp.]